MLDEVLEKIKLEKKHNSMFTYNSHILLMDKKSKLELIKDVEGMVYYQYKNDKFMGIDIKEVKSGVSLINKKVYNELLGLWYRSIS